MRSRMGWKLPSRPLPRSSAETPAYAANPVFQVGGQVRWEWAGPWVQPVCMLRERAPAYYREGRGNRGEVGSQCRLWGALKKPGAAGGQGGGGLWKDAERGWRPSAWLGGCVCGTEVRVQTGKLGQSCRARAGRQAEAAVRVCEWTRRPCGRFLDENVGCHLSCRRRTGPAVSWGPCLGSVGGAGGGPPRAAGGAAG